MAICSSIANGLLLSLLRGLGGGWARFATQNSSEDITGDCDVDEEFKDLDIPAPFPLSDWNWLTTSRVENIGIVGEVEVDPRFWPLPFDWW